MPIRSNKHAAYAENTTPYVSTIQNGDGPQTDYPIGPEVELTQRLLVYQLSVKSSSRTALNTLFRFGFGSSVLPIPSKSGTPGMLIEGDIAPGWEMYASPGIGEPGERLLVSCDEPQGVEGKIWAQFYCEVLDEA